MTNTLTTTRRRAAGALAAALAVAIGTTLAAVNGVDQGNSAKQKAPAKPAATITLTTKPTPPVSGNNDFMVTVKGPDGNPVVGADVSVLLVMPAMPSMKMPEMKNTIALKAAEGNAAAEGKYTGRGQVPTAGKWNVTVSVKVGGKDFAEKTLTFTAK